MYDIVIIDTRNMSRSLYSGFMVWYIEHDGIHEGSGPLLYHMQCQGLEKAFSGLLAVINRGFPFRKSTVAALSKAQVAISNTTSVLRETARSRSKIESIECLGLA